MDIEDDKMPYNDQIIHFEEQYKDYSVVQANSKEITVSVNNYIKKAIGMIDLMRKHQILTDVVLEVEKELFHAHKVVLAAASPYFKAMFTGGLKECETFRVKLQGICQTSMAKLLHFMYTGEIHVTELTVCQILSAATMFQVTQVIDVCCSFLERQLHPSNAIGIANFAEQHGCRDLHKKATEFMERHFIEICKEEEFLQLSASQLLALIRKDELNVPEEKEVYNAVLKWVKYDKENRNSQMEHILYAIRCQYLTPNFLKDQIENCDVLKKLPACSEYLTKIFQDLILHKKPCMKKRIPNSARIIFVAGGYCKHSLDILEAYNIDDRTWIQLCNLRLPRSGLGGTFFKNMFYAVGGRNISPKGSFDSNQVDRYNFSTDDWKPCAALSIPRNRVGVSVMDELLYAAGGSAGSEYHKSVERYDPDKDQWTIISPMKEKRSGVGLAVINRILYAVGGYDGEKRLNSCEYYHPENDEWNYISPMNTARSGAGVAALNQYIYVVGGYNGKNHLKTVERYDTERNVWEFVAPVEAARSALSVSVLDNKLYALGGYDGLSFLSIVEIYDPFTNSWEESVPLTSGRSGHASAVYYH